MNMIIKKILYILYINLAKEYKINFVEKIYKII